MLRVLTRIAVPALVVVYAATATVSVVSAVHFADRTHDKTSHLRHQLKTLRREHRELQTWVATELQPWVKAEAKAVAKALPRNVLAPVAPSPVPTLSPSPEPIPEPTPTPEIVPTPETSPSESPICIPIVDVCP